MLIEIESVFEEVNELMSDINQRFGMILKTKKEEDQIFDNFYIYLEECHFIQVFHCIPFSFKS